MKKFKACVIALMLMFTFVSVADAKSRVSSSRSSFKSPVTRSYSAPKAVSKPSNSYNGNSFFSSKPAAQKAAPSLNLNKAPAPSVTQPKVTLKSLGFTKPQAITKPVTVQTVKKPSVVVSPKPTSNFFGQKKVVSTPTKTVVTRKVVSPTVYRSQRPVVIQRNYYNNYGSYNGYGYNRGYGSYYGNHYGGSSFGSNFMGSALGAFGGMMIYDALTDNSEVDRLQQKVDQLSANQQATNALLQGKQSAPVAFQPPCLYPQDAPLVMSYAFYCQPQNSR